ncbi:M16 family metallopeptidase [Solemya velesiana gill symbiont]|nr:pitrilysin family protein [Solemya velesiana gill symbiont]
MRLSVLLGLLLIGLVTAQAVQAGPKIESWQTANGASVMFVAAPDLPMVDIRVVFDAGSARDSDLPGLAVLTNALLTDDAGQWNADQLAERLESLGIEIGAGARRDMAWVSIRSLTDPAAYQVAMSSLAAVLAEPRFEEADLERNRQAMQVSLRRGEQNPGTVAKKAFWKAVFGSHPYAIHSGGTQESLAAITRQDILAYHKRYYVAKNATVAIVGALDRAAAETLAEQLASGLPVGEPAAKLPEVGPLNAADMQDIAFPSSQSHILMGQPGMRRGDPDYFILYVGNHILGGSGLVSQLSEEVREKRGLSYSVYSYFSPMRRYGPFIMGAQTQNAKVEEATEVMRTTLKRFIEHGPTEDELTAAKRNITGSFPLRIASNSNIVEYLAMIGFYGLPLDYLDAFVGKVESVTGEQIRDAFKRRLKPDNFVTIVVGNGQSSEQGS